MNASRLFYCLVVVQSTIAGSIETLYKMDRYNLGSARFVRYVAGRRFAFERGGGGIVSGGGENCALARALTTFRAIAVTAGPDTVRVPGALVSGGGAVPAAPLRSVVGGRRELGRVRGLCAQRIPVPMAARTHCPRDQDLLRPTWCCSQ